MKIKIDVADAKEAKLIRVGLADPETRALVKVMGALIPMKSNRTRANCLRFTADKLDEERDEAP